MRHDDAGYIVAGPEPVYDMGPSQEFLERWRRDAALVVTELREWAKRDSDGWTVSRRRHKGAGILLEDRGARNKRKAAAGSE